VPGVDDSVWLGFSITATELYEHIAKYTTDAAIAGWSSLGQVISGVKNIPELRWANTLEVKNTVEKVFNDKFGAKEAAKPKGKVNTPSLLLALLSN
jgi:glutaminyl-tRNA synthetase